MSKRWLGLLLLMVWIGSSGVAQADVVEAPDPLAIGNVAVGQSASVDGTLTSTLAVDTTVTLSLGTTGDCAQFQITSDPAPLVSIGEAVTVEVQLTPTSPGAKTCQITMKQGTTTRAFTVTGTGIGAALTVSPQSPPSVDFGSVRVANAAVTSVTRTFTLGNSGTGGTNLNISNIVLSSSDYVLSPAPTFPLVVAQGSTKTVTVKFDPTSAGVRAATMTVQSDDPATPSKVVNLTGIGTTALIAVTDVDFGIVADGATSNQNITITNSATSSPGTLKVTSATVSGGSFFSFGTGQGCNGGTSCTFTQPFTVTTGTLSAPVRCQLPAAAAGAQTATVTFTSDTEPGGDTTAQLTCTAGRPNIVVSTSTLAFNNVPVNTPSTAQTFTIMNTGNSVLNYNLSKTPNLAQFAISGCTSSCSIAARGMVTFNVTFTPSAIGTISTRIDITNNDPDPGDNVFSIDASGTGTAPLISVVPAGPVACIR